MSRAILLVDHGSRLPEAHAYLERLGEEIRERSRGTAVYLAHLELAPPSIDDAIDASVDAGVRDLVVHPLFLIPGRHARQDVPSAVERAASRHPGLRVRVTEPLGQAPELAELILRITGSLTS
ncbi:MAG: CbiX/SirB N-terminal domain-containing protein [Myxococcota bacterium]